MKKEDLREALQLAEFSVGATVTWSYIIRAMLDTIDDCPDDMTIAQLKEMLRELYRD